MTYRDALDQLESEAIQILRDGVAEADQPVLLFSGGKDSTVLERFHLNRGHIRRL